MKDEEEQGVYYDGCNKYLAPEEYAFQPDRFEYSDNRGNFDIKKV